MARLLVFAVFLSTALSAQAQPRPFSDPNVWVSASYGAITWAQGVDANDRDNIISNFSVTAASPRWIVQGGAQISSGLNYFEWDGRERDTYRSVYAVGGPWTQSTWFMAGAAVGPALTWGTRIETSPVDCYDNFCTLIGRYETERYLNPGLAGSVQGFVRLDGRVWLGGETMLVANASSTHLASRLALRVDLLRPGR